MDRKELRLAPVPGREAKDRRAAACGVLVLAAAIAATASGADRARRPFDPVALAEAGLNDALFLATPQAAASAARAFRDRLVRVPLDPATRTIAASLALELAETPGAREAAFAQAEAALRLAPWEEGVRRAHTRIAARCGRIDRAIESVRETFGYAPRDAAASLADIEPFVPDGRLEDALPDEPAAWLAWSSRLRELRREADADARLAAALARFPGDLEVRRVAAGVAASRGREAEVARLVPADFALPAGAAPALFAFRARSKARAGDAAGAREDAAAAVAGAHDDPGVLVLAGDAVLAVDPALSRGWWTRAAFALGSGTDGARRSVGVRVRLARLDEREGRAGDALRTWRSILASQPDHAEARRRVAELTGELRR